MYNSKRSAYRLIILLGIVSLFGDITYEGARSITGPFLAVLGASAGVVGFVTGFGEFTGYVFRLVSGYIADRTQRYWLLTITGYVLLLAIPFLAFAGHWYLAVILISLERIGKGIRKPARDVIISYAAKHVGRGLGFGLHEAMDQIGAIIGPLIFSLVFLLKGSYREGFTILWIPALLTVAILIVVRFRFPAPEKFETTATSTTQKPGTGDKLPNVFWLYSLFTVLSIAGFVSFQLIAYHFKTQSVVEDYQIPLFYMIAMGVDGVVALIIGKTYDSLGMSSLIVIPLLTVPIPFCAFTNSFALALIGVILWGMVMGIHETVMRAAIADLTPVNRRGFAFGMFNTIYGASWFMGSTVMGLLYDISITYLFTFIVIMETLAILSFAALRKTIVFTNLKNSNAKK
ncbi:MFS transporter [bacterium SM23_31]|nr:MAG: MFS transporter [bacterium SM23_31]